MGLTGGMHIGQIKSGIKSGIRLAQGKEVKCIVKAQTMFDCFLLCCFGVGLERVGVGYEH